MADDFVQVAPDSSGKKIDNTTVTTGAGEVYRQATSIGSPTGPERVEVAGTEPADSAQGLVTRVAGTVVVTGVVMTI